MSTAMDPAAHQASLRSFAPPGPPSRPGQARNPQPVIVAFIIGFMMLVSASITLTSALAMDDDPVRLASKGYEQTTPWIRALAALVAAFVALRLWRRRWQVLDAPTVPAAAVYPGVAELHGYIRTDGAVRSWVTGTPSARHATAAERGSGKHKRTMWSERGESDVVWFEDASGRIPIEPALVERLPLRPSYRETHANWIVTERVLADGDEVFMHAPVAEDGRGGVVITDDAALLPASTPGTVWCRLDGERAAARVTMMLAGVATFFAVVLIVSLIWAQTWTRTDSRGKRTSTLIARPDAGQATLVTLLVLLALLVVAYTVRWFNRFVEVRNQTDQARAWVDVNLQRRHDLIERLVTIVRAAAGHEQATLLESAAGSVGDARWDELTARLEATPSLRSNENFSHLMGSLVDTENRIAATRHFYNNAVTVCRDRAQQFPASLVARVAFKGHLPELLD